MKFDYQPKSGEFFVALGYSYAETKFIQATVDKENEGLLNGTSMANLVPGEELGFFTRPLTNIPGPYFPIFSKYDKKIRRELLQYYKLTNDIRKLVDDFIIEQPKYIIEISILEKRIIQKKFSIHEVQAVLKSLLGDAMSYKYSKTGKKEYIRFADDKVKAHNQLKYYSSIASELAIKSHKISLLVSHGQTVGNYREVILRDLIKQHLPGKFGIGTGFIQGFAKQLDIIIYDALNYAPSFKEGDLVVIKQEAVRGVIEVKTTLSSNSLFEALDMFHQISLPGYKSSVLPIFKGIYSFDSSYRSTSAIAKSMYDFYNKPYFEERLQKNFTRDILYLFHEISCVTTLSKHCILSKYAKVNADSGNIIPQLYSISDSKGLDIQTAVFMASLFEYLDVEPYAKKDSIWSLNRLLSFSSSIKHERNLTDDDWFPRSRGQHEHDFSQESIKECLRKFDTWFTGGSSTQNLIDDLNGKFKEA